MDFGGGPLEWLDFVPDYKDNRTLPPEAQVSLQIRRLRSVDVMAQANVTPESLHLWRTAHFKKYKDTIDDDVMAMVNRLPAPILQTMRVFVEHTRNFTNFTFDGIVETDPTMIFLQLPLDDDTPLTERIAEAIAGTAGLDSEQIKNYSARLVGTTTLDSPAAPVSTPQPDSAPVPESAETTSGTTSQSQ